MRLTLYRNLSNRLSEPCIRWAGLDDLSELGEVASYSAIHADITDPSAAETLETYLSIESHRPVFGVPNGIRSIDGWKRYDADGISQCRFMVGQLLAHEWSRRLNGDRIDIIVSDWPAASSVMRTYKGVIEKPLRDGASCWEQIEVKLQDQTSVIFNRLAIGSSVSYPPDSALSLGDTNRSFGLYGLGAPGCDVKLESLAKCFGAVRKVWRWDLAKVLAVISDRSASLLFYQGLASIDRYEVILYLPRSAADAHVEVATKMFGAKLFEK